MLQWQIACATALLLPLYECWWMCCDNRRRRGACASSPNSSWQQPQSCCRIDQDSRRHTDLFNVVSLNTLSCATHNTDTNRKSLSVCLTTEMVKMFCAWVTSMPTCISALHWLAHQSKAWLWVWGVFTTGQGGNAIIPLDAIVCSLSTKILWHIYI